MIDPDAIVYLGEGATVDTKDGREESVSRIAVWDYWEEEPEETDETLLRCHTNSGEVYVNKTDVDKIDDLE